jgi:hypothetical protein
MSPIVVALFYSTLTSRFKMEFSQNFFKPELFMMAFGPIFKMPKMPLMHFKYLKSYPNPTHVIKTSENIKYNIFHAIMCVKLNGHLHACIDVYGCHDRTSVFISVYLCLFRL